MAASVAGGSSAHAQPATPAGGDSSAAATPAGAHGNPAAAANAGAAAVAAANPAAAHANPAGVGSAIPAGMSAIPAGASLPGGAHGSSALAGDAAAMAAANAANAAGGAAQPGAVAGAGSGEGGAGQGTAPQAQKGTLEYAILKLAEMAKSGNYEGVDEIISERAKNLAATIRDGELTEGKIESFKTTFDKLELFSSKSASGGRQFILKNSQGQLLQFLVIKEGQEFVIRDFMIRDAKK